MRVIELALKDLLQIWRDRKSLVFLLAMPIVFTAFIGFAIGQNTGGSDPRLPVGWVDEDGGGILSGRLYQMLADSSAVRPLKTSLAQAEEDVRKGTLAAALVVPPGFSQEMLGGKRSQLTLIVLEANSAGQTARQAVQATVVRLLSMAQTARLSVELLDQQRPLVGRSAYQAAFESALDLAAEKWEQPALEVEVQKAFSQSVPKTAINDNPFNQSSPGILVQFSIFGLTNSAMILVLERKTRTLQRLLTTTMRRSAVIAGHLLAMFLVVLMQGLVLILVGQFGFGVNYLRQPLAVLVVLVTLGLWVSGLGLLIGVMARGEEQVILWGLVAMFILTGLGGAWFPLEVTSPTFSTIGHLLPSAWAMDGFQNIIVRGLGFGSVLLPAAVMLVYAFGFFGLAVWRFRLSENQ